MRRFRMRAALVAMVMAGGMTLVSGRAAAGDACAGLPSHAELQSALAPATATEISGLNNQMWATIVNRDGVVCAVAFSGVEPRGAVARQPGDLRPEGQHGQRLQPRQLVVQQRVRPAGGLALSTANLYSAVQPGGSLYGLQHSNPVDTGVAYAGNAGQVRHQE